MASTESSTPFGASGPSARNNKLGRRRGRPPSSAGATPNATVFGPGVAQSARTERFAPQPPCSTRGSPVRRRRRARRGRTTGPRRIRGACPAAPAPRRDAPRGRSRRHREREARRARRRAVTRTPPPSGGGPGPPAGPPCEATAQPHARRPLASPGDRSRAASRPRPTARSADAAAKSLTDRGCRRSKVQPSGANSTTASAASLSTKRLPAGCLSQDRVPG